MVMRGCAAVLHGGRHAGCQYRRALIEHHALVEYATEREVKTRSIGIDMREAAGDGTFPACDLSYRITRHLHDRGMEVVEALPGHRGLEGGGQKSARDGLLGVIGSPDESVAPCTGRTRTVGILIFQRRLVGNAATVPADLQRTGH